METAEKKIRYGTQYIVALGSMVRQNLKKPYPPILRSTLASITLPATGASTWAAGSHV